MTSVREADDHVDWPSVVAAHEAWHGSDCNSRCEVMEFARAALQAAPVSIDRDRLATALCATRDPAAFPAAVGDMFVDDECRTWAGRIIAEYDRLSHAE